MYQQSWNFSIISCTINSMDLDHLQEVDLFPPLQRFLSHHGYLVHAEVVFSDISAVKEGELLVVEIKLRFNLEVILQAVQRQQAADAVYIAVPLRNFRRYPKRWKEIRAVCSRLGIGILFVRFIEGREPTVEIALSRKTKTTCKDNKMKELYLEEMTKRGTNKNIGGSTRTPLFTAYRAEALKIARLLNEQGPLSPRDLRSLGSVPATGAILRKNYYGWFEKVNRGIYQISEKGKAALKSFA